MTVYVDDMRAPVRGFKLCHMLADTHEELMAMVARLNLPATAKIQKAGTPEEHYDIALSKRAIAVRHGAKLVDSRELVRVIQAKRQQRAAQP